MTLPTVQPLAFDAATGAPLLAPLSVITGGPMIASTPPASWAKVTSSGVVYTDVDGTLKKGGVQIIAGTDTVDRVGAITLPAVESQQTNLSDPNVPVRQIVLRAVFDSLRGGQIVMGLMDAAGNNGIEIGKMVESSNQNYWHIAAAGTHQYAKNFGLAWANAEGTRWTFWKHYDITLILDMPTKSAYHMEGSQVADVWENMGSAMGAGGNASRPLVPTFKAKYTANNSQTTTVLLRHFSCELRFR